MDTSLRNQGALVIALHLPRGDYVYNPSGDHVIEADTSLIVLATMQDVKRIQSGIEADTFL